MTRELRRSEQFSLKVSPNTFTAAPFTAEPAWIINFTVCSATYLPMPSLMRRPARMT